MNEVNKEDIGTLFIVSIASLKVASLLVNAMSALRMKIMLVYDIPSCRTYTHARFLSKRDSIEHIVRTLMNALVGRGRKLESITTRQACIVRRLASGQKQMLIACDDYRSSKTISGIKKNIFDKIGLRSMNDLSLLLADILIRAERIESRKPCNTVQGVHIN
ncbi:hypothetical protein ABN144_25600 [Klebsiella aerogenes]